MREWAYTSDRRGAPRDGGQPVGCREARLGAKGADGWRIRSLAATRLWLLGGIALVACPAPESPKAGGGAGAGPGGAWAIALHGGAGTIPRSMPAQKQEAYRAALRDALSRGKERLEEGRSAVDVVEEVIRILEDDPHFNAGRGAVFNAEGQHELDASVMSGRDRSTGAVAGVRTVRHPITLARRVMERTPHVLLMGEGADRFAAAQGIALVKNAFFSTPHRFDQWQKKRAQRLSTEAKEQGAPAAPLVDEGVKGTVGVVALDQRGDLAAGTSTGGLTDKRWGRVGDSPLIGAGTYADNASAAISATGWGEEFIRHSVTRMIAARMELLGESLEQAAHHIIRKTLRPGDGGVIAVDRRGALIASYNTDGMYRGLADSKGRFEIRIWE